MLADLPDIEYNNILVVNALNGTLALVLRDAYPTARIVCGEVFPFFKEHLTRLGFEVVDWEAVSMKFDLVIGNPPYQGNQAHGLKIWPTFTVKALSLLADNGYIGWITPSGWIDSDNAQMKKVRTLLTSEYDLLSINRNANNYFDVGVDIQYFLACNRAYSGETVYTNGQVTETIDLRHGITKTADELTIDSILKKVVNSPHDRLQLQDEHLASSEVSETETTEYCHPIIYSTSNRGFTKTKLANDGILKLALNVSSAYYSSTASDNNMPITTTAVGALMCYLPLSSVEEGARIKSYLCSKLIRFVCQYYRRKNTGFNHAVRQRKLPKLDSTKSWTDRTLYKHFKLTPEEIAYVEANVR